MNSISWGTVSGFFIGFGLFVSAIVLNTDNYGMFVSASSFLMVVGGTLAATMIAYQERYVLKALKSMAQILVPSSVSPQTLFADVERLIRWSKTVQINGLPALQKKIDAESMDQDAILTIGVKMLMSDYSGDMLGKMLGNAVKTTYERNMVQVKILNSMATVAPAFGMVGTLVGLIIMLDNMGGDPAALGAGLAVALLTTLYGVLFAQLILKPASTKLRQKEEIDRFRNTLLVDGFVMLADKKSPWQIEDHLNSYLDPHIYFHVADRDKKAKT